MKFLEYLTILLFVVSCGKTDDTYNKLKQIDALLYEESDLVADSLLNSIGNDELDTPEKINYYNLLKTGLKYRMGNREQTDSLINICIDFYSKNGDKEKLAMSLFYHASIDWNLDDENILLELKRAEALAESVHNYGLMAKIYSAITNYVGNSTEFEMALKYSQLELYAAKKTENKWLVVYAYINLLTAYNVMDKPDSALYYARQCEAYLPDLLPHYKAYVYSNLGELYIGINDSLAEAYLKKSIEYEPLPQTYTSLAEIYNAYGKQQSAKEMWDEATDEAWPKLEAEILEAKAAMEYENGNLSECINTLKDKENALTEFYESKLQNKVLELESKYDIDLYHQKVRNRTLLVLLLIVVLVFMHRIRVRSIENRRVNAELDYQKTKNSVVLYERRIAELQKSKTAEVSVLKDKNNKLKAKIQNNLQHGHDLYDQLVRGESPINWSDYDLLCLFDFVSTIGPEFILSLDSDYTGLNNQQKLFLLVSDFLGKSDYEVCQMFGLEKQSFHNKRYRIAKKRIAA
ncbi:MAG: hypothetical protein J6U04_10630 [Salinivirgaceae bacterium]|nr:hypothetical protein [Salinivirgaceae bacterium]